MKNKKFSAILLGVVGLSIILFVAKVPLVGAVSPDLNAPEVTGTIDVDGVANETFWANATSQTFTLSKSIVASTPTAVTGQDSVEVKAVITATEIVVFFKWKDITASNTGVGSEDRLALMLLTTDANPMAQPCMVIGTNGATTSGTVDQWHWKAARTDSDGAKYDIVSRGGISFNLTSGNATYTSLESNKGWFNFTETPLAGGSPHIGDVVYTNGTSGSFINATTTGLGTPMKLNLTEHTKSFAENEFIDTTERQRSGDSEYTAFGILPSTLSGEGRYLIEAKGSRNTTGYWTLEMKRTLTPSNTAIDRPMASGDLIKFAVAVYDGAVGHDEDKKYITQTWRTLLLGPAPAAEDAIPGYSLIMVGLITIGSIGILFIIAKKSKITRK